MAIARDNSALIDLTGTTALSQSFTCSGVNRILFVMAQSTSTAWGGFTYNGVALTQIQSDQAPNHLIGLWYLINPASGAHTLAGTWGGNQTHGVIVQSYTGVHQTTPINTSTTGSASATSLTTTVTTTTDNCWAILAAATGGGTAISAGTNATLINSAASTLEALLDNQTFGNIPTGSFGMQFTAANAAKGSVMAAFAPVPNLTGASFLLNFI